jgi:hypothetical protein
MSPNRVVAVLTPLVFAPLAGVIAAWLAKHFPAVNVSQGDLQEVFVAGALIALVPATQWLHGWQKHEAQQADAELALELAHAQAPPEDDEDDEPGELLPEPDGISIDALLDELDQPVAALDHAVPAGGEV